MIQFARPLFLLVLVISAVLIGVTTDRLPAKIASHFGEAGPTVAEPAAICVHARLRLGVSGWFA
jgi:hypothetical protein